MAITATSESSFLSTEELLERDDFVAVHARAHQETRNKHLNTVTLISTVVALALMGLANFLNKLAWRRHISLHSFSLGFGTRLALGGVLLSYNRSHEKAAEALQKPGFYQYCLENNIVKSDASAVCQAFDHWMQGSSPLIFSDRPPQVEAAERRALRLFYQQKQLGITSEEISHRTQAAIGADIVLWRFMQLGILAPASLMAATVALVALPLLVIVSAYFIDQPGEKAASALLNSRFYRYCTSHDARWLATEKTLLEAYERFTQEAP